MEQNSTVLVMYSNLAATRRHIDSLLRIAAPRKVAVADSEEHAVKLARTAEVILGQRYFRQCLPQAPALRWVQSTAAGVEALVTPELLERDVRVSRCPIFGDTVARHALAMALALQRRIPDAVRGLAGRDPAPAPRCALVFGTGAIGISLACMLAGLGIRVTGVARRPHPDLVPPFEAVLSGQGWRQVVGQADLCFLTLPNTRDTRGLFDAAAVDALPVHAVLVNVGRPQTLDERHAIRRLGEGGLAGLGLDVISAQALALAESTPIPGLLVTPKVATFGAGRDQALRRFVEDQLERYCAGRMPEHVVPREELAAMESGR